MKNDTKYREIKDKLNKAFRTLRNDYSYFAKQSFLCCQGCGWAEATAQIEAKPDKYKGIVFYHKQDADTLHSEKPGCYLAFSSSKEDDDSGTLEVGQNVVKVMESVGLKVTWDGNTATRILVELP